MLFLVMAMVLRGEPAKLAEFSQGSAGRIVTTLAVIGGSLMAFTYNFVSFKFLALTSSVTHAICGNIKLISVVIVPALFIDRISSASSWVGFCVFLCAAAAYTYLGHRESARSAPAATVPREGKVPPSEATPLTKGLNSSLSAGPAASAEVRGPQPLGGSV